MSKLHLGLRRAGFAGAASALALGGALVAASSASALVGNVNAISRPSCGHAGHRPDCRRPDLRLRWPRSTRTRTITFTIPAQQCNTPAQIAPRWVLGDPDSDVDQHHAAGHPAPPVRCQTLGSRTANCATAGVRDQLTVTLPTPAGTPATTTTSVSR